MIRSPGSISSARLRLRSLSSITANPCSRVAAWFSGDPVRIQVRIARKSRPLPDVYAIGMSSTVDSASRRCSRREMT